MFWFSDNWCLLPVPTSTNNHSRSVSSESNVKIANYQEQYCKCLRHHTLLPDKWIWSHGSLHILRRLGSATVENARDKIRMTRTLVTSSLLHCSFSRLLLAAQRVGVEEAAIVRTDPVARSGPKICCQELLGESWNGMGYYSGKGTGGPCPIQHRCHTSSCTDTSAHTLATTSTTTITGESFDNNAVIHVTQLPSRTTHHAPAAPTPAAATSKYARNGRAAQDNFGSPWSGRTHRRIQEALVIFGSVVHDQMKHDNDNNNT